MPHPWDLWLKKPLTIWFTQTRLIFLCEGGIMHYNFGFRKIYQRLLAHEFLTNATPWRGNGVHEGLTTTHVIRIRIPLKIRLGQEDQTDVLIYLFRPACTGIRIIFKGELMDFYYLITFVLLMHNQGARYASIVNSSAESWIVLNTTIHYAFPLRMIYRMCLAFGLEFKNRRPIFASYRNLESVSYL